MTSAPRSRFRLWPLTLIVTLAAIAAWIGWELRLVAQRQNALKWLSENGAAVKFSDEEMPIWRRPLAALIHWPGAADVAHPLSFVDLSLASEDKLPKALECVRGLDCVGSLAIRHTHLNEEAVAELSKCNHVKELILTGSDVGTDTLKALAPLSQLEVLLLNHTAVSDADMRHIRAFAHLTQLDLSDTAVTDRGLDEVGKLVSLRWLILQGTQITSAGIPSLASLPTLVDLDLSHTRVDEAGARAALRFPAIGTLGISSTDVSPAAMPGLEQRYPNVLLY
jgi:hypothetical protein